MSRPKPILQVEIADTPLKHQQGLMGRKFISKNSGMLFDFGNEKPLSFWMYNTYIPLQIAFVKKNGEIGQIENMAPLSTRAVMSKNRYQYAIEAQDGWFDENNIRVGSKLFLGKISQEQNAQQEQSTADAYDATVVQSYKDILKAANDRDIPVIIEYVTDEGLEIVPALIEPPFEFISTKDGDPEGRVLAWNFQNINYGNGKDVSKQEKNDTGQKSYIIDNIKSIKDKSNTIAIVNVQQLDQLAGIEEQTQRDTFRAKGLVPDLKE